MMLTRLDSAAPELMERFRLASPHARRRAALLACEHAVAVTGLVGADVELALGRLRDGARVDDILRRKLGRAADELDEQYFRFEADEALEASRRFFNMARASSALAFALVDDDKDIHEAIYEALAASEDPSSMVARLVSVLT